MVAEKKEREDELLRGTSLAARARYGLQWACFWYCVGLLADASWGDALVYGAGIGFGLGWVMRVGIFRYLWWKLTFRELHLWKTFDWRRFF